MTVRRTTTILVSVVLLAVLRLWVLEPMTIASDSMEPTLQQGSSVLVLKLGPAAGDVTPGRLVIFPSPHDGHTTIKRLIAAGGQTVAIRDAVLFVDGTRAAESFVDHRRIDGTYFGPVTVPEGYVFVLGDNRATSIDSRHFGPVPRDSLEGTVPWR